MNDFQKSGYFLFKKAINPSLLEEISKETEDMFHKGKKNLWPFIRVYNDYPYLKGNINVFGLDYPLNRKLNSNIFNLINKLDYGQKLKEVSNWKNFNTSVIRLHVFENFFNYEGFWHRDGSTFPTPNQIQSVIYLKDEKGFRLVPKDKNHLLEKYDIPLKDNPKINAHLRARLPDNMFDVIDAKAGDVLFFEAALLHQGFSKHERMHFHLRHENLTNSCEIDKNNIFNFNKELMPDYNLNSLYSEYKLYEKKNDLKSKLKRCLRLVFYFLPRFKSIYRNVFRNKDIKETLFHNTFYQ